MPDERPEQWIVATEGAKTLPIQELLTGRGFVSGKSGSGKSNTVSVICEELLEANYTLLIVDTEGEYFGLKERYELLHVGGDDFAEVNVGPEHADKIAEIALEKNVPVILDVSGYDDTDTSEELITRVVDELYTREKHVRKPFLLVVEEMQEYLPQQGGSGELAELLERVAKRGRKRGLGMCGVSQRPSSVDKDYITQCDWMAWHKFTWESDLKVVSNVIGNERAAECENFNPGEAYLMTDWDDTVERVQFRRKRTFDAGATPGLESYERPNLKAVGDQFISEIRGEGSITDGVDPTLEGVDPAAGGGAAGQSPNDVSSGGGGVETSTDELLDQTLSEGGEPLGAGSDGGGAGSSVGAADSDGDSVLAGIDDLDRADGTTVLEPDIDGLDDEELSDRFTQLTTENRLLKDEISELRDVTGSSGGDTEPAFRDRSPSIGGTSNGLPTRHYSFDAGDSSASRSLSPPSRPNAPAEQDVSDGVAHALFEFGELMIYLWKLFVYYLRLSVYKGRVKLASRRAGEEATSSPSGRSN